jgi:hypothetical protein
MNSVEVQTDPTPKESVEIQTILPLSVHAEPISEIIAQVQEEIIIDTEFERSETKNVRSL